MSRPHLILPVENQSRELDARLLLACVAAERGFRSILGAKKTIRLNVTRLPRGIFVAKGVTRRHLRIFRILRRLGFAIVCADEEGLVHPSAEHYLRTKVGADALAMAEALFAWGPENARIWRVALGSAGVPIHETGNPRTDLLRPELRGCFSEEAAALRARLGRFVLVNTNFSRLNHYYPHMSWQRQLLAEAEGSPERAGEFEVDLARHRKAVFEAFLAMLPVLARAVGDAAVVVRPHPSESHAPWREAAAGLPNVHVVHEGGIVPWLLAAEATLHNGCTTALETHLLGRAAIAYQPVADERFDNHLPNGMSFQAFSQDQLLERVSGALHGPLAMSPAEREARDKLLGQHVAAVDGRLAADRIVDALDAFAEARPLRRPSAASWLSGWLDAARLRRRKLAKARLPGNRNHPAYVQHVFPGVTEDELAARIDRFRQLLGRFEGVEVRPVMPDVFEIRCR